MGVIVYFPSCLIVLISLLIFNISLSLFLYSFNPPARLEVNEYSGTNFIFSLISGLGALKL